MTTKKRPSYSSGAAQTRLGSDEKPASVAEAAMARDEAAARTQKIIEAGKTVRDDVLSNLYIAQVVVVKNKRKKTT